MAVLKHRPFKAKASSSLLMLDEVHEPTEDDDGADHAGEAECAEAEHLFWLAALGDSEDD
jgi:hypothetical protein